MKKIIIALLTLLCLTICTIASADGVPEDVLHEAILTLTDEDTQGEVWVEGHVVLGTDETDRRAIVYASVYCQNFGFMGGIFTDTGSGFRYPIALIFEKTENGFTLREIQEPQDGKYYWPSLQAMMPQACLDQLEDDAEEHRVSMKQQMYEQAQRYLDSIDRTETVGDWRDLNMPLSDILVTASNHTGGFSPPYPLWVTERELLENGERYTYTRSWEPDGATGESQTYVLPNGDIMLCDGTTGTVTLTKTRCADDIEMERITIRAELYDLYVVYADAFGTKEYHFIFDGKSYHQPTITENGSCQVDYPSFDLHSGLLPK